MKYQAIRRLYILTQFIRTNEYLMNKNLWHKLREQAQQVTLTLVVRNDEFKKLTKNKNDIITRKNQSPSRFGRGRVYAFLVRAGKYFETLNIK